MGMALIKEGKEDEDVIIKFSGSFLNFLSNLMYDEKQMILFSTFCNMFSAKKILENMEETQHDYIAFLKGKNVGETDSEFLKRLNDLKNNQGNNDIL
jgi:hypothetical protein